MKLYIFGRAEDIEQMIAPMVNECGEKLKITVHPCPVLKNEPRRFYVEVETKKKTDPASDFSDA